MNKLRESSDSISVDYDKVIILVKIWLKKSNETTYMLQKSN